MRPPAGGGPAKQPVEFDQAISYVNKIKVRLTNG
jgi:histone deacetylase complex regulatory component SIN3